MAFNFQIERNKQVPANPLNPLLNETSVRQKGAGTGTLPAQPLVNYQTKNPVTPVFFQVDYNTTAHVPFVNGASTVGLTQIIVTGINFNSAGVLAVVFDGAADYSLSTNTVHNLNNVPNESLFLYFDNNTEKLGVISFGGEAIVLWQKRTSQDFRQVRLRLIDISTGNQVPYTNMFLWLLANTNVWQG